MAGFENEAALAKAAVSYLLADGWDCYFEVSRNGHGGRADIVATSGPLTAIIETKMSLGFGVLAQCERWVRGSASNFVIAAVPEPKNTHGYARGFAKRAAKDRGIGIWEVPPPREAADYSWARSELANIRGKGGDILSFPPELRVREFPTPRV